MINFLKGTVINYKDGSITLLTNSIGFQICITENNTIMLNQEISLYIHLQWHQEHGPLLYGFQTELEKAIFLLIISCSGIGPKIALAILSTMKPGLFLKIIQTNDEKALSSVNGIGTKKAEQLIVHLRHKAAKLVESGIHIDEDAEFEQLKNISEVLTSLNYSKNEISQALHYIKESYDYQTTFDQQLRKALSYLSKRV